MSVESERAQLRGWLDADFGAEAQLVFPLCVDGSQGRPLYFTHVDVALSCVPEFHCLGGARDSLCAGYIYLTAAFYCIDAQADGHHCGASDLPPQRLAALLPLLIQKCFLRFADALASVSSRSSITWLDQELAATWALNSHALKLEAEHSLWTSPPAAANDEFLYMWARSCSAVTLFKVVEEMAGTRLPAELYEVLKHFLYWMQWGDDIGDWREDFRARRLTPFLRKCIRGQASAINEARVEEIVYLERELPDAMQKVADEIDALVARARVLEMEKLAAFMAAPVLKIEAFLATFGQENVQPN